MQKWPIPKKILSLYKITNTLSNEVSFLNNFLINYFKKLT